MTETPISSMLMVLLASVVGSFGAVFLKLGAIRISNAWDLLNWRLVAGVGLYLGSSIFYGMGIKNGQISVLFPMVSLGYVLTMVWARFFFKEQLTREKFIGLGVILVGIVLVGLGSQ